MLGEGYVPIDPRPLKLAVMGGFYKLAVSLNLLIISAGNPTLFYVIVMGRCPMFGSIDDV